MIRLLLAKILQAAVAVLDARSPKGGGDAFLKSCGQSFDAGHEGGKLLLRPPVRRVAGRDRFENSGLQADTEIDLALRDIILTAVSDSLGQARTLSQANRVAAVA